MLHFLIVIPYYFFASLTLLSLFVLIARVLRLKVSINVFVYPAITLGLGVVALPLIFDWWDARHLPARGMFLLIFLSLAISAIDFLISRSVKLPLDDELADDQPHPVG